MRFTLLGGNAAGLKRQNRAAVLRAILGYGPLSRRAICRETGLTASTISNIVGELAADGLVRELATVDGAGGPVRTGRPEVPLDLDPLGGIAIGAHIGVRRVSLAAGDLRAGILQRNDFLWDPACGPIELVRQIGVRVDGLLNRLGSDRQRVLGMGAATVGLVDAQAGVLRFAPELDWHEVPLRALLAEATGLAVAVDSGRRAMALAEMMFGRGQGARDFMLVHVGTTIGAGIVVDQQLARGATAASGSIGHTAVAGASERCHCGRTGCLDTVASDDALERRALELAGRMPDSPFARALEAAPGDLTRHRLYYVARVGDATATAMIVEAGRHVGLAIANVMSVLDPELVLLAGEVVHGCPAFVDAVRAEVEAHAFRAPRSVARVLPSAFGSDVRIVGGLGLALHDFFYAPSLSLPRPDVRPERVAGQAAAS